jgi:DNA invertase Pin-like site-specific DNA recombinase
MRTFIVDMVLQILSWIAEEERTRIRQRQREGIDSAQRKGVKLGRPQAPLDDYFIDIYNQWKQGQITAVEASKRVNVNKTTYYRMVKRYEQEHT